MFVVFIIICCDHVFCIIFESVGDEQFPFPKRYSFLCFVPKIICNDQILFLNTKTDHNSRIFFPPTGKILLVHLLTVVADHRDHLGVARVLLNNKTTQLGYGLIPNNIFTHNKNFTGKL